MTDDAFQTIDLSTVSGGATAGSFTPPATFEPWLKPCCGKPPTTTTTGLPVRNPIAGIGASFEPWLRNGAH